MLLKYLTNLKVKAQVLSREKGATNTNFAPSPLHNQLARRMLHHLAAPLVHRMRFKKNLKKINSGMDR